MTGIPLACPWTGYAFSLSPWDSYVLQVEEICGKRFTDGVTIDMLYALYQGDVPVERAAEAVGGMQHASVSVRRVLADLERMSANNPLINIGVETIVQHDSKPAAAPRAALARRNTKIEAEWRVAGIAAIIGGGITLLIAFVLAWGG